MHLVIQLQCHILREIIVTIAKVNIAMNSHSCASRRNIKWSRHKFQWSWLHRIYCNDIFDYCRCDKRHWISFPYNFLQPSGALWDFPRQVILTSSDSQLCSDIFQKQFSSHSLLHLSNKEKFSQKILGVWDIKKDEKINCLIEMKTNIYLFSDWREKWFAIILLIFFIRHAWSLKKEITL